MRHVSLMMWALGRLRYRPPSDWVDRVMEEVAERRAELGPHELTLLLHG